MNSQHLVEILLRGYLLTVLVEMPVLFFGLSARHSRADRVWAALWLNGVSYPVVILVIPAFIDPIRTRPLYLAVAETFAPLSECLAFRAAFPAPAGHRNGNRRDAWAIVLANLASFGVGELLHYLGMRWF